MTACRQRKTSHFIPILKLSITYHHIIRMKDLDTTSSNEAKIPSFKLTCHHIIRMKDFDNTSSNEAKIPSFKLTYHHIIRMKDLDTTSSNEVKMPSFSLLTGLLASYICSALYLLHTETNSRSLSLFPKNEDLSCCCQLDQVVGEHLHSLHYLLTLPLPLASLCNEGLGTSRGL